MKYDYLIVGSGLTGSMYASVLKSYGSCLVIDKNDFVGGLCKTEEKHGILQHTYGAHIFRTDSKEVWDFVNSICKFKPFINTPIAVNGDHTFNMPFNMNTFSRLFNVVMPNEALESIKNDCIPCDSPSNLEEYILSKLGRKIYDTLIKGYTYKQWGRECKDLPVSVMSHIPIRLTYNNNYFNEEYQGIPEKGYSYFIESLLDGCEVVQDNYEPSSHNHLAKKVIYTGAIDEYFDNVYGELDFRSVRFEHEYLEDVNDLQGVAVMNFVDYNPKYTRRIEHKHFLHQYDVKGTVISYEYPCTPEENGMRIYPVEDNENLEKLSNYNKLALNCKNVKFVGQQADFKSYNMNQIVTKVLEWKKGLK